MPVHIKQVLAAWELAADLSRGSSGGATAGELTAAERALGRALPRDVHDLYAAHNGGDFLGGNIQLLPLLPSTEDDLALASASALLRSWGLPVPPALVVFGSDGSDSEYGLWLPAPGAAAPLVVELGESTDEDALAIVGDDLASFLAGRSAYYLLLYATDGHETGPALDALGVPTELRVAEPDGPDEDAYDRLLHWASPGLPDPRPDPYARGLTPQQVDAVARQRRG